MESIKCAAMNFLKKKRKKNCAQSRFCIMMSDVAKMFKSLARILIYLLFTQRNYNNNNNNIHSVTHTQIVSECSIVRTYVSCALFMLKLILLICRGYCTPFFPSLKHNNNIHGQVCNPIKTKINLI